MKNKAAKIIRDRSGISRAVVIMLVLVAVMLVVVSIPIYNHLKAVYNEIDCMTAMKSADDQLRIAYLHAGGDMNPDQAKAAVEHAMNGWDDLCPGGGNVYLVEDKGAEMPYRIVCGVHGSDLREVTRLNSEYVRDRLMEQLASRQKQGEKFPETMTVVLNSKELEATLIDEESPLRRGTNAMSDFKGIVCFYAVKGNGDFGKDSKAADGEIWYFSYADENFASHWSADKGWWGTAHDDADAYKNG